MRDGRLLDFSARCRESLKQERRSRSGKIGCGLARQDIQSKTFDLERHSIAKKPAAGVIPPPVAFAMNFRSADQKNRRTENMPWNTF
jgi:hypothetical protein